MDSIRPALALVLTGQGRMTLSAVVTRADGTVEDFGLVYDNHPWWLLKRAVRRLFTRIYNGGC